MALKVIGILIPRWNESHSELAQIEIGKLLGPFDGQEWLTQPLAQWQFWMMQYNLIDVCSDLENLTECANELATFEHSISAMCQNISGKVRNDIIIT